MVGVPRSKGCRICVQRRVRCDQTRPTCNNCKKGNRPCPGYGQDLKFQDEGVRLRKRYEGDDAAAATSDDTDPTNSEQEGMTFSPFFANGSSSNTSATRNTKSPPDSNDNGIEVKPPASDSIEHWDVVGLNIDDTERRTFIGLLEGKAEAYTRLAHSLPQSSSSLFTVNLIDEKHMSLPDRFMLNNLNRSSSPFYDHINDANLTQKQLVTVFKENLFPDDGTTPDALKTHSRWLSHLPPLTGSNPLLDASVRAVTLVQIGRLNNSEPFIMESRPYYGKALRLLNKTLQDRKAGTSNETLCAVILLSFYEMFASDNNDSWVRHAGGVSALMRARGPQRHRHGFDREIFLAYRYTLVIESFQAEVPCFLAEPAWRNLSAEIHSDLRKAGVDMSRLEIFELAEEFYTSMLDIPELCAHARALIQARQNNTPPPYNRAQIVDQILQQRAQFKSTFTRFEIALKKAGHAPTINLNAKDPLISIEYNFVNTFVSATYIGFWTVLTALNLCLKGLQHDDREMVLLYHTENKECSLNICRSCTYTLKSSFLGPFFLIFGLRIALIVFEETDGPEADWVLRKLFEIGDRHMGIAKHIPGYRAGISADELIREFRALKAKSKEAANMAGQMEFSQQVILGDVCDDNETNTNFFRSEKDTNGFESTRVVGQGHQQDLSSGQWRGLTHVDDVLKVWEEQDNFELQSNMNQLNVHSVSTSESNGASPAPMGNSAQEQQFSRAAAAFAMPDMNFFDSSFPVPDVMTENFLQVGESMPMSNEQPYDVCAQNSSLQDT